MVQNDDESPRGVTDRWQSVMGGTIVQSAGLIQLAQRSFLSVHRSSKWNGRQRSGVHLRRMCLPGKSGDWKGTAEGPRSKVCEIAWKLNLNYFSYMGKMVDQYS